MCIIGGNRNTQFMWFCHVIDLCQTSFTCLSLLECVCVSSQPVCTKDKTVTQLKPGQLYFRSPRWLVFQMEKNNNNIAWKATPLQSWEWIHLISDNLSQWITLKLEQIHITYVFVITQAHSLHNAVISTDFIIWRHNAKTIRQNYLLFRTFCSGDSNKFVTVWSLAGVGWAEEWLKHCSWCNDTAEERQSNSIYNLYIYLYVYEPYSTVKSSCEREALRSFCLCYKVCLNILCTCNILIISQTKTYLKINFIFINYSRINTVIFATSQNHCLSMPFPRNCSSDYNQDKPGGQPLFHYIQ